MPWSPPKKITLLVSVLLEIIGLILGVLSVLISTGFIPTSGWSISVAAIILISVLVCFGGWLLLTIGVLYRGI